MNAGPWSSYSLHVRGGEYSGGVVTLPDPPAVLLLVVDVDDVPALDAQLVVHVGRVVIDCPTLTWKYLMSE